MNNDKLDSLILKIVSFAEKINSYSFRPYQHKRSCDIVRAALLNEGVCFTNLWARRSGKSEMLKATSLALMSLLPSLSRSPAVEDFPSLKLYKHGFSVAIAGPKLDTASIPFVRLRRQARQSAFLQILNSLNIEIISSNSRYFELSNGSVAQAFSGSETASNEGPGADLLMIDEAAMLSPFSFYKILRPMVAASNGSISETGTPWKKKCPFLSDIEFNKRKFPHLHFEVPYTDVIPHSKEYATFIDSEIDRLPGGIDNPFFRMNYLLEWLIMEGHFVKPDQFLSLAKSLRREWKGGNLYAGIDWGKIASATCIVIMEDRNDHAAVIDLLSLKGDFDLQFAYLIPFLLSYPLRAVCAESVGLGDPLTERLSKALISSGHKIVIPKFTTIQFKNSIFTRLLTEITANPSRFYFFDDNSTESKAFISQFLDAEVEITGNLLNVHKPNEEGATDDFVYATAFALDALLSHVTSSFQFNSTGVSRGIKSAVKDF